MTPNSSADLTNHTCEIWYPVLTVWFNQLYIQPPPPNSQTVLLSGLPRSSTLHASPVKRRCRTDRRLLERLWMVSSWSIFAVSWWISASSSFCVWSTCWQSRAKVVAISLATQRAQCLVLIYMARLQRGRLGGAQWRVGQVFDCIRNITDSLRG